MTLFNFYVTYVQQINKDNKIKNKSLTSPLLICLPSSTTYIFMVVFYHKFFVFHILFPNKTLSVNLIFKYVN